MKFFVSVSGASRVFGCAVLFLICVTRAAVGQGLPVGQDLPLAAPERGGGKKDALVAPAVTVESVNALRAEVASSQQLTPEEKERLDKECELALDAFKSITAQQSLAAQYEADTETVRTRLVQLQQELEALKQPPSALPTYLDLAELAQEVARRERDFEALKKAQLEAEDARIRRVKRRQEIRPLLLSAAQQIAELDGKLKLAPPADEMPLVTKVQQATLLARRALIEARQPALEAELAKYDAEDAAGLLRAMLDVRTEEVTVAGEALEALRAVLNQRRAADTAAAVRRAQAAVAITPPELQADAQENVRIAEAADLLSPGILRATRLKERAVAELEDLQKQFKMMEQRVNDIGLTGSIGAMLRRQRAELPDVRERRQAIQDRKLLIEKLQYGWYEYDDLRSESEKEAVERILAKLDPARRSALENAVATTVSERREFLSLVIRNYKAYLDTLFELDATEQRLIRETGRTTAYIDERIMWIRSNRSLFAVFAMDDSTQVILHWEPWQRVGDQLRDDARGSWLVYAVAIVLWGGLVLGRRRIIRRLEACGELAARGACVRFSPTVRAGVATLILAVTWSIPLMFLGWRFRDSAGGTPFTAAFGEALVATAWLFFAIELVRWVCHPQGLGRAHFAWPAAENHVVRSNLRWVKAPGLLIVFATSLIYSLNREHGADTVERVGLVLGMILLATLLARVLRPEDGIYSGYLQAHRGNWFERLKHVWYWGCVTLPLVLAVMTIAGYYYTARVVLWRVYLSFLLWILLQVVGAGLRRLLLVRQRAIHRQQTWAKRDAQLAARRLAEDGAKVAPDDLVPAEERQQDIAVNSEQTKRLIRSALVAASVAGIWFIWIDVLPALRMLDRWPLWTNEVQVVEASEAPEMMGAGEMELGPTAPQFTPIQEREVVTVGDLALALLLGFITVVGARNIPGLMEISVLQRLPLENSVRYAIKTLTSYVIVLLGVALAFQAISIGWSKVQWLATALMFGLAFGLQEIFANSMAGLILLFEQPIRVGDVITVDDITGVVSRMRIRATTITNWDRKEYVIPNKEFITGRVLNWTLTDKTNRIVIHVGIAYGANVEQAKDRLLQICRDHPLVLEDPPPLVTLEGFGDNTLNLVVRTYLPDLTHRLSVTDELHTAFEADFREHGIEIAFPQRDLHIRSVDESVWKQMASGPPPA